MRTSSILCVGARVRCVFECSLDGRSLLLLDKEVRLTKFVQFIPSSLRSGTESIAPIPAPSSNSSNSMNSSAGKAAASSTISDGKENSKNESMDADLFESEKAAKTVLAAESEDEEERIVVRKLRRESPLDPVKEVEDFGILADETPVADPFFEPDRSLKLHDMFMSCASEMVQDRCFLAWNEVGLIIKRFAEGVSSIEIEFTDRHRKRLLFSETGDIVVASLSPAGAILGGVIEEENGKVSGFVVYRAFNAWSGRSSWRADLPGRPLPFRRIRRSARSGHWTSVQRRAGRPALSNPLLPAVYVAASPLNASRFLFSSVPRRWERPSSWMFFLRRSGRSSWSAPSIQWCHSTTSPSMKSCWATMA